MQAHMKVVEGSGQAIHTYTRQKDNVCSEWKALAKSLRVTLESKNSDSQLRQLLNECMALYRSSCAIPPTTDSLLASISGRNSSQLEAGFMWLGGWRPSSAVTLVYSKMGARMEKCNGCESFITSSCMLSKSQLSVMQTLHNQTGKAEAEISNSLASVQMLVADQDMTEAFGMKNPPSVMQPPFSGSDTVQAQHLMDSKLVSLRTLYMQANGLRLHTLQELHNLLTPVQAAQCAVTAFEITYALRNLGDAFTFKMSSNQSEVIR